MTRVQGLSLAIAAVLGAAWLAPLATHHVCRIVVIDDAGERWIAGEGDTLADATQGAQLPSSVRSISFPGCYR